MFPSQTTGMIPQGHGTNSSEEQPANGQGLSGVEWYACHISNVSGRDDILSF